MPDGVLVIDKPAGMTSHDAVDLVRRRLSTKKVGHAGTLDPDATGVLVVGVGRATRLLDYAQSIPKRYTAIARLGASTTTQDAAGEVLEKKEVTVHEDDVAAGLKQFLGQIDQVPPMVSAVKVGGERLYKKARRGEEIDRPSRRVTVYEATLRGFESPDATIEIRCSAGTYVRTLIHDLGQSLGCGAHLLALRRTEAGGHSIAEAIEIAAIDEDALRPLTDALFGLAQIEIDDDRARLVGDGRPLEASDFDVSSDDPVAVVHRGELLAVYRHSGGRLVADRVLAKARS